MKTTLPPGVPVDPRERSVPGIRQALVGAAAVGCECATERGALLRDKGAAMPKYLLKVNYTGEGLAGVMKDGGSARRSAAEGLAKDLGGSLESFLFAFGDVDAYCVADLPDNKAAATLALTVSSSGRVSISTVPLITVDEMDEISAGQRVAYTPPGT